MCANYLLVKFYYDGDGDVLQSMMIEEDEDVVRQSDVAVAAVGAAVAALVWKKGLAVTMAMYGAPLIVVKAWLVVYTWLQHTDVDDPHYSNNNHNFVKSTLHTIDHPYDKFPWLCGELQRVAQV